MSDNFYDPNDPTLPARPPVPPSSSGQQDKLVLGSFRDQPSSRSPRRPYQNPAQGPGPQQSYPAPDQPYSQRPPAKQAIPPGGAQNSYGNAGNAQYNAQRPPVSNNRPYSPSAYPTPPVQQPPYQQRGQVAGAAKPPRRKRPRRRTGCLVTALIIIVILCVVGVFAVNTTKRVLAFGSAVSNQPPLSSQTDYMNTSARTNVLLMGYGGLGHQGAYLTDSMSVISVMPTDRHTSLISVPRDLWIQYPPNSGQYTKINAVYEFGSNFNKNPIAGGNAAAQKVSLITGLNVKYWITINFAGFKDLINSIGGINVYVPDSFNACYPANDNANINASWIKVQFNKGMQHMDGATAIEYARAREPLAVCGMGQSENLAELTDFARSARQQIIMKAVLSQFKQISTWPKLYDALNALQRTIYTNMSLADLAAFALKMNLSDPHTAHIGLSNQNVLMDSSLSDGTYILLPQNDNWQLIVNYVKQHLYN